MRPSLLQLLLPKLVQLIFFESSRSMRPYLIFRKRLEQICTSARLPKISPKCPSRGYPFVPMGFGSVPPEDSRRAIARQATFSVGHSDRASFIEKKGKTTSNRLERLAIFGVHRLADILGRTHTLVTSGEWITHCKFSVLRHGIFFPPRLACLRNIRLAYYTLASPEWSWIHAY
jgi:hypothetical protein